MVLQDWEDEDDDRTFGQRLKDWGKSHDWNRQRCAEELRVGLGVYNNWCGGSSNSARSETILRLMNLIDYRIALEEDIKKKTATLIRKKSGKELKKNLKELINAAVDEALGDED